MVQNESRKLIGDLKIIGFDADDTLWVNEPYYRQTEVDFCEIMKPYLPEKESYDELFRTEMQNLELYGYGAKGFMLSMIETALRISGNSVKPKEINGIIGLGRKLLNQPVVLLDHVAEVLLQLKGRYKLILATKGDLLDQERKLVNSGLAGYFHHIEIMSDKTVQNYRKLIQRLDVDPGEFMMIGNSVKSDIIPVLEIGAKAIHIPCDTTWLHERIHGETEADSYITVGSLYEVLSIL